jgi:glycosyltransferase involved in cell wall biosynthesis
MAKVAIVTNAETSDQRSMIGYGELLLESASRAGHQVAEWRAVSWLSRLAPGRVAGRPAAKLLANLDRFVGTPMAFAGRRADIVHIVDPGNVPYLDVVRCARAIVTVHDVIPYLCVAGRLQGFQPSPLGRRLMAAILKRLPRFQRIVCVSENTRRDLLSLVALAPERIIVIPNAIFQPMQRAPLPAQASLRQRLGLPPDAPVLLHVGSNSFYKNRATVLAVFLRLAAAHPTLQLLFVGPRTHELVSAARAAALGHRVHFAERLNREEMSVAYSLASALLFPSLYEGFGYPVLEAQLCGTPVVCSHAGSLPEVAGDAAVLTDPMDVDAMAAAIARVLATEPTRLIDAGHANAQRFDKEIWHRRHAALYADVLKGRATGDGARCLPPQQAPAAAMREA